MQYFNQLLLGAVFWPDMVLPMTTIHTFIMFPFLLLQVDIFQGLFVIKETWRKVLARKNDSMFVKDSIVTVWNPAQLQGRSCKATLQSYLRLYVRSMSITPFCFGGKHSIIFQANQGRSNLLHCDSERTQRHQKGTS